MRKIHEIAARRYRAATLAGGFALALAGPAAAAGKDTIVLALPGISQHFDPTSQLSTNDYVVFNMIFDGLMSLGPEGKKPGLAKSWTISEDGRQIDFALREGVKFHNGDPLTARDVKFSFEALLKPDNRHAYGRTFRESIERVEVVDDHTARFILKQPWSGFFTSTRSALQSVIPQKYYEQVGPKGFQEKPVGTGPFKLVGLQPGESTRLAANEAYWGGAPEAKIVELRAVAEPFTRFAMLQRGEADIITGLSGPLLERIAGNKEIRVVLAKYTGSTALFFNRKAFPEANDRRVRIAIGHAIDREKIAKTILGGVCEPGSNSLTPGTFGYAPGYEGIPYDPEKAKALLREAGVPPGKEVTFSIHTQSFESLPQTPQVLEAIASSIEAVGFTVKREPVESGAWFPMMRGGKQPGIFYAPSSVPDDGAEIINNYYTSWSTWVPGIMNVPEYDQIYTEQLKVADLEKREKIIQRFMALEQERREGIPLFWCDTPFAIGPKIAEMKPAMGSNKHINLHAIKLAK
jgi:peptide/nickel transport system substrate-binding protein